MVVNFKEPDRRRPINLDIPGMKYRSLLAAMDTVLGGDTFWRAGEFLGSFAFGVSFWIMAAKNASEHLSQARATLINKMSEGAVDRQEVLAVINNFNMIWSIAEYYEKGELKNMAIQW
ncbi:hypothetical protein EDC01DRAFT_634141 [Geopyxis carbonaria]|nr:hypothetical protein EDC01DRAFT_634141 [Geopyxis carbonaria]